MISKQDILDRATEWSLRPDVVEKDYVLGWLLFGLAVHPEAGSKWVFKGGTCIKKCYLETYRFSEDLDFTLLPEAQYSESAIRTILQEATRTVAGESGIEFPPDLIEVRPTKDKLGRPAFQGRISYRGPLAIPTLPRVLLDLTQHEPVIDPPTPRAPFHPYPDKLPEGAAIRAYTLNELLAEKSRALYERTRPRDLYDVVYLLENRPEAFDLAHVREAFQKKCGAKEIAPPAVQALIQKINEDAELRSEWENMLGHQLPVLPKLDDLLRRLGGLLTWIDTPTVVPVEMRLSPAPVPASTRAIATPSIRYWGHGLPLESIRFAGANRLLIEFDYDGRRRAVEPYSLREASTGNILLYAWEQGETHIKAFNVEKISHVKTTNTSFAPRYRVEFTPFGSLTIPAAATPAPRWTVPTYRPPRPVRQNARSSYGPVYVFECGLCGKKFPHSKNDPKLGKHKTKDGYPCSGRHGYFVETKW